MMAFFKAEKKLGVSDGKRRYDLPLNKDSGTGFLVLLIGLMTFLALMTLLGSFLLSAVSNRWESGLENKATIEIPAENPDGSLRNKKTISDLSQKVALILKQRGSTHDIKILSGSDIQNLVSPWLGSDVNLAEVTLPGLISVSLTDSTPVLIADIQQDIEKIAANIHIDTHQAWLSDILRFTSALQFATLTISLIIGLTTATAIAGAIKSRIAIHKKDVELLHLMGASDSYISRQFQRHAFILSFQGALGGTLAGFLALGLIRLIGGVSAQGLLPDLVPGLFHIVLLALLPVLVCAIAVMAARHTVLRALSVMP
jgi:cell division transport system permease protein